MLSSGHVFFVSVTKEIESYKMYFSYTVLENIFYTFFIIQSIPKYLLKKNVPNF